MSSGLQRTSSRLKARASPYNSGVTLYGLQDASATPLPLPSPRNTPNFSKSVEKPPKSPQKSKTLYKKALAIPHPAPQDWRQVFDCIKEMRSKTTAPVDTMGCHMAQRYETEPKTKDQVTDAAVCKLRTALGGSVSLDAVLAADPAVISEAINKVGMWRVKTKHLKLAAEKLRDEFDSDVPKTIEGLISLPGVGPKIGFLALQAAWNINVGIGVDVHVLRITRLLGWHKADTPEDARISLESWLPAELQPEINPLLVGFGQTTCPANSPRCGECSLAASGLCPSAKLPKKKPVPDW
ncbi:DNA glycosylase [Mycena leptocephala]|nr:DNA glycosylase [Mycena leptocephala]